MIQDCLHLRKYCCRRKKEPPEAERSCTETARSMKSIRYLGTAYYQSVETPSWRDIWNLAQYRRASPINITALLWRRPIPTDYMLSLKSTVPWLFPLGYRSHQAGFGNSLLKRYIAQTMRVSLPCRSAVEPIANATQTTTDCWFTERCLIWIHQRPADLLNYGPLDPSLTSSTSCADKEGQQSNRRYAQRAPNDVRPVNQNSLPPAQNTSGRIFSHHLDSATNW
jgi:hypothetical protein